MDLIHLFTAPSAVITAPIRRMAQGLAGKHLITQGNRPNKSLQSPIDSLRIVEIA